jgi:hypothetical protein
MVIPRELFQASKKEWSVIVDDQLATRELGTWRWLKTNATTVFVMVLGAVVTAILVAALATTPRSMPALPATSAPATH